MSSSELYEIPEVTPSREEQSGSQNNQESITNRFFGLLTENGSSLSQANSNLDDSLRALREINQHHDSQSNQIQVLTQEKEVLNQENKALIQQNEALKEQNKTLNQQNEALKRDKVLLKEKVVLQKERFEATCVEMTEKIQRLQIQKSNLKTEKSNLVEIWKMEQTHFRECLNKAKKRILEVEIDLKRFQESENEDEPAKLACIEFGYTQEQVEMAHKRWKQRNTRRCHAPHLLELLTEIEGERMCSGTDKEEKKKQYEIKYPKYADIPARKDTYLKWPHEFQEPEKLADAGLFYTGYKDCVRCFSCDVALSHWDPEDDPWIEHARWSPHCTFLREIRQQYNNFVQSAFNDVDQGEELLNGTEVQGAGVTNTQEKQEEEARLREVLVCKVVEDGHHYVLLPCNHLAECAQCSQQCDCSCPGAGNPVQGAEGGIDPASE